MAERVTQREAARLLGVHVSAVPKMVSRGDLTPQRPWRRNAEPGFIGPHTAFEWTEFVHSGGPIGCHKTIQTEEDWSQRGLRQCAGAAVFRSNDGIAPKSAWRKPCCPQTGATSSPTAPSSTTTTPGRQKGRP